MKRSRLFTLLSSLGIGAAMILTAALVAWIGRTALGGFEEWQQESNPYNLICGGGAPCSTAPSSRSGGTCSDATDIDHRIDYA